VLHAGDCAAGTTASDGATPNPSSGGKVDAEGKGSAVAFPMLRGGWIAAGAGGWQAYSGGGVCPAEDEEA
jgi:hypothetical protein